MLHWMVKLIENASIMIIYKQNCNIFHWISKITLFQDCQYKYKEQRLIARSIWALKQFLTSLLRFLYSNNSLTEYATY